MRSAALQLMIRMGIIAIGAVRPGMCTTDPAPSLTIIENAVAEQSGYKTTDAREPHGLKTLTNKAANSQVTLPRCRSAVAGLG